MVLGLFNAAIGITDIRDGFRFSEENSVERAWVGDSTEQHVIKLGTLIRFFVKSVQEKEDFLDIAGSLEPTNTGSVDWLAHFNVANSRKDHKQKRKSKTKELDNVGNLMDGMKLENGYLPEYHMPKKRKIKNV